MVGILPYIALQLKAIIIGFELLSPIAMAPRQQQDAALVVTLLLAVFVIMFATRRLDTTEPQHGVMLAIAFESLLKLAAFLVVGAGSLIDSLHKPVSHWLILKWRWLNRLTRICF